MTTFDPRSAAAIRLALALLTVLPICSCALVPKESVELSTTVGRDIGVVRASHRDLANTLFDRMRQDVNRFVDDVYAPYQIGFALKRQKALQNQGNPANLFSVLEKASRDSADTQAQKDAIGMMEIVVQLIHEDVEEYRKMRLRPIEDQQKEVLASIEGVYDQIERGNATVTAHLASIVKVHEAQDELLTAANLQGMRENVGVKLSEVSSKIATFVGKAQKVDGALDGAEKTIGKLTSDLDKLLGKPDASVAPGASGSP